MVTINKKLLGLLLLAIFLLVGFVLFKKPSKNLTLEVIQPPQIVEQVKDIKYVLISGQKIKVDLAITEQERNKGLSLRPFLSDDVGMLFVFDKASKYFFWMKEMNFPIDIIWIGEDKKIVYIKKDAKPESYPEVFGPSIDAKYVLEVVSGFSDKYNLKEGDEIDFEY